VLEAPVAASDAAEKALRAAKQALRISKQSDHRSRLALTRTGRLRALGQAGPAGPIGPVGPRGPEGFDGKDGATGLDGATGPAGQPGLPGSPGLQGIAGATGPAGTPGLSASASVAEGSTTDISSPATTVIDLDSTHEGNADAQIVIGAQARIMATASVQLHNPSSSARKGVCELRISDGSGPAAGLTAISRPYSFDLPATDGYDLPVSLAGAAPAPAGTYNVRLVCGEDTSQSLEAVQADLVVWAAAG
jgi:hypothetical protein